LKTSTPIEAHVAVDFQLRGCPINKYQLLEVLNAFLNGRRPNIPTHSVCIECKRNGVVCVMVAHGTPCMGPVTHAGCGALCPAYNRGCYGCFGPMETPNARPLSSRWKELGVDRDGLIRAFRSYNAGAESFRKESEIHEAH
jgi:coenzyme F420-reducing hydrogenase gamma subunit